MSTYQSAVEAALKKHHVRGEYALAVALGHQCLSGADLRGRARQYSRWYARQRARVIRVLETERLAVQHVGTHNRRYLVDCATGVEVGL